MDSKKNGASRSTFATRALSLATLVGFVSGVGYVGSQAYRAATDSFVAPIILSPDNDLVLANKLKMSEIEVERAKTAASAAAIDDEIAGIEKALGRLRGLHEKASNATAWLRSMNQSQFTAGASERKALDGQHAELVKLIARQTELVANAKANMEAGLVSRTDYAKEEQALAQAKLALFDNERNRLQTDVTMHQLSMAQRSLAESGGRVPMPELLMREDDMVRLELEIMKLEADARSKSAERKVLAEKLAKIDELGTQLKARPIVRAMDRAMDVAFVPYTQIDGVKSGGTVFDCTWGLFNCRPVGAVAEVVPGEVILPDPWGNQARGQYVVLSLQEHDAAKSKCLRVRGGTPPAMKTNPEAVSVR